MYKEYASKQFVEEYFKNQNFSSHTHSWNDLTDKPFGEETSVITIYNGNVEMVGQNIDDVSFTSGSVLTSLSSLPDEVIITVDGISTAIAIDGGRFVYNGHNINVSISMDDDGSRVRLGFSHGGDYSYTIEDITIDAVTKIVNTIDSKYLPETYASIEYVDEQIITHTHSWNDLTDKPFETNAVSEKVLWYEGLWRLVGGFEDHIGHLSEIADKDVVVTFDGTEYESHCNSSKEDDHDYYIIGVGNHYISQHDYSDEPLFVLPSNMKGPFEIKIEVIEVTNIIPDEVIPDTIARSNHTHSTIVEMNENFEQRFWRGTKEEYDAIEVKDESIMYIVIDEEGGTSSSGSSSGSSSQSGDMSKSVYDPKNKSCDIFAYADNIKPRMTQVSLIASNWNEDDFTQSVYVDGILGDPTLQYISVIPSPDSMFAAVDYKVYCLAQAENELIFGCTIMPSIDINFNVVWQNAIYI